MFIGKKPPIVWLFVGWLIQCNVAGGNNHMELRSWHWRNSCHRQTIGGCLQCLRGGAAGRTAEDEELDAYIEFLLAEYALDDPDGGFGEDHLPADEEFSWGEISFDFQSNDFERDGYTSRSHDEPPVRCQEPQEKEYESFQGDLLDDDFYARLQNLQKALHFDPDYECNIQEPTHAADDLELYEDMEDALLAERESVHSTEKQYPFTIESSDPESDSDGSFDEQFATPSHYSAPTQYAAPIPYSPPTSSPTTDNVYTDDEEQENNILCRVVEKTIKEKMQKDIQEIDSYINQLVENHDLDQYIDELLNHDLSDLTEATDNFDEAAAAASLLLSTNAVVHDQAQNIAKGSSSADLDKYIDKVVEQEDLDDYIEQLVHDMPDSVDDEKKSEVTSSVAAQDVGAPQASIAVEEDIIEILDEVVSTAEVVDLDNAEVSSSDAAVIIDSVSVDKERETETAQVEELSSGLVVGAPSEPESTDTDIREDTEVLDASISIHTETSAEQLVEDSTDQVQPLSSEGMTSSLVDVENEMSATSDVPSKPKKKRIKKSRKNAKGQTTDNELKKEEEVPSMVNDTLPSMETPKDANATTTSSSVEKVQAKQTPINGLYHFLLRKGPVGKTVLMFAICLVEWMKTYLPQVTRGIVWLSAAIAPESLKRRMAPRRLESGLSADKLSHRYSGRLPVTGKQRKDLKKRADREALATLQRIGDIERAKYRYVSQDFMRVYDLGGESVSPAIDTVAGRAPTEEEEESDMDWVVKGIMDDKSEKKLNDEEAPESLSDASPMDGSFSVGVNFELKSSSSSKSVSKRLQGKSLVQAAMKKDQSKKPVGPSSSDRDGGSGVMGRIRAVTGANSMVSRSLLGAYPGDVVPPTEAGSAEGVSDLARRYGYGEWSDDEDDSNDETNNGSTKNKKRKRRRKTTLKSKKKATRLKQEGERTRRSSSRKTNGDNFIGKFDSNSFSEAIQALTEERRSTLRSPNVDDSNNQVKMGKTSYESKKVKEAMHSLNKLQERSRKKRKQRKEE